LKFWILLSPLAANYFVLWRPDGWTLQLWITGFCNIWQIQSIKYNVFKEDIK